jgi:hypothetical protein
MNKAFQLPTNENIACVAIAGFRIGKTMKLKVENSLEPSIRAASKRSSGRFASMYCLIKKTVAGAAIDGRIKAKGLLIITPPGI